MQADDRATDHLDDERLAAFVDGALGADERAEVERHLAACDVCRVVCAETVRTVEGMEAEGGADRAMMAGAQARPAAGTPHPSARRSRAARWAYAAGGLAAAAAIVLVVWRPGGERPESSRPELAELVAAVGDQRPFAPRLSGGFAYGEVASRRSGVSSRLSPDIRIAVAELEKRRSSSDPASRAAFGVGALISGDAETAVAELQAALDDRPGEVRYLNDLAAARLVQAESDPERQLEHATAALDALAQALSIRPGMAEALFNRALASEIVGPRMAALDAWDACLAAETDERWAGAARRRRDRLAAAPEADRPGPQSCAGPSCLDQLERTWFHHWSRDGHPGPGVAEARVLAGEIERQTGDRFGILAVDEWVSANIPRRALARGWNDYLESRAAYERDDLERSSVLARGALESLTAAHSVVTWAAHVHLATLAYRERDLSAATTSLRLAHDESARLGLKALHARSQWLLGMVAWQQLRPGEALGRTEIARNLLTALGDLDRAAQVSRVRADYFRHLGLQADAWRELSAAALPRHGGSAMSRYLLYFEQSQFAESSARPFAAAWFQDIALQAAADTGLPAAVAEARIRRARLRLPLGDIGGARQDIQTVNRLLASLPDEYLRASADSTLGALAPPAEAIGALTRAIASYERLEPPAVPLLLLERARVHRRVGAVQAAQDDLDEAMSRAERWRMEVPHARGRIEAFDVFFPIYGEAVDLAISSGREAEAALRINERFRGRHLRDALGLEDADDLLVVARHLPRQTFVLVVTSLPERLALWVITRDGIRLADVEVPAATLARQVDRLREGILSGAASDAVADTLSGWLLDPIEKELAAHTSLVLIPDAVVARLPVAFLLSRRGKAADVGLAITQAPSLAVWRRDAQPPGGFQPGPFTSALVVTNPHVAPAFAASRGVLQEAELDVSSLATLDRVELRGSAATARRILSELPHHDLFHFSGHAVGAFGRASLAGLLVSPEGADAGLLSVQSLGVVTRHRLRMVVLAGCSTSAGPVSTSEGPQSVAWAFLRLGVPAVVATLWDVEDYATSAFMRRFYEALRDNGPDEAMVLARRALRTSGDPRLNTPAAWAGFILFGTSGPHSKRSSPL